MASNKLHTHNGHEFEQWRLHPRTLALLEDLKDMQRMAEEDVFTLVGENVNHLGATFMAGVRRGYMKVISHITSEDKHNE